MRTADSKGRRHPEPEHAFRAPYARDRDRIVHSTAFRRLMHKTQVFVSPSGDHHRTRLTHTLEVAQISRTIARQLNLNEDLTEAIALMHDLGHPPFGHSGERVLDECMMDHGGFEHNRHGLRIVEQLEYRYPEFPGLNLSWEVLEAQAMHGKDRDASDVKRYLGAGQPLLEAQVVDAADSLAYDTHDVDDALSMGLITPTELDAVPFWSRTVEVVRGRHRNLSPLNFQSTVIRAMVDRQVTDLLETTRRNLEEHRIVDVVGVRKCPITLVAFSPEVAVFREELEEFLRTRVYRDHRVTRLIHKGQRMLSRMFDEFVVHPDQLPERYLVRAGATSIERTVCDYLAGMTDRFAMDEHARLFTAE